MNETPIKFTSRDGTVLAGIIAAPINAPLGAVVLAHGITAEKNEGTFYKTFAAQLAAENLLSLRFDFRGHGESERPSHEMTISGEIEDLSAAIDELQARGFKKVAIIAASFGGGIAALCAEQFQNVISSLALISPVLDYRRTFLEPETPWTREWFSKSALENAKATGYLNLDGFQLGHALIEEFSNYSPKDSLARITTPTLIAHGDRDSKISFAIANDATRGLAHVRFVPIPNAEHGFVGYENEVFCKVIDWVKNAR
jgi:pimeloyl-ACP methyl ester carboxylesterase